MAPYSPVLVEYLPLVNDYLNLMNSDIQEIFTAYPDVRSMGLAIGQFWNDEASDAVQLQFLASCLDEPDWEANRAWEEDYYQDGDNRAKNPNLIDGETTWPRGVGNDLYRFGWNDSINIPLLSAFCEEGSQDYWYESFYAAVTFRPRDGYELHGQVYRPYQFGVDSEYVGEEDEDGGLDALKERLAFCIHEKRNTYDKWGHLHRIAVPGYVYDAIRV